jgi:hypothetical protein
MAHVEYAEKSRMEKMIAQCGLFRVRCAMKTKFRPSVCMNVLDGSHLELFAEVLQALGFGISKHSLLKSSFCEGIGQCDL